MAKKKKTKKKKTKKKKTKKKKYKRARTKKGRYIKDDKSTPFWNEAWQGGKSPKRKKLAFERFLDWLLIR